ncbi:MAG: sialidase family protein [Planctomycetota bacterium]
MTQRRRWWTGSRVAPGLASAVIALGWCVGARATAAPGDDASPMAYAALKDREVAALALTPDGDVLAGTDQGVWRVRADGTGATQLSFDGLPLTGERRPVLSVACDARGDVFAIPGHGAEGLFRLRAGSGRWESVGRATIFVGVPRERASALAVLPDGTLLVGVTNPSMYRGETGPGRVYRSRDGGATFDDVSPDGLGGASVSALTAGPGREVWAVGGPRLTNTMDPTRWVLMADDARASPPRWRVGAIARPPKGEGFAGETAISAVAVDRDGVGYALVTSGLRFAPGIYRSKDRGATWQPVNDAQEANALVTTPDAHVYVGSYGGVIRSLDGGTTWTAFAGLGKTFVSSLLVDRAGHLWAGTTSHGQLFPLPGLFRSRVPVGTGVAAGVAGPDVAATDGTGTGAAGPVLFDNGNLLAVEDGPRAPTTFTLAKAADVARITTYHWHGGRGAPPGTLALRGADGRVWGPYPARAQGGPGRAAPLYWVVEPRIGLAPGTYTVVDSDPATWSHNAQSGHRGMVTVEGPPPPPPGR